MQTLKVSKVRARKIAEPKIKIKYPKTFSIKTEDSSITVLKNDLPWTLHPLPPPLSTATTVKIEADKSMPWALHPLPPPVKTKNYSDYYYWPDSKIRPKYVYMSKPLTIKPYKFANAYKHHKLAATAADFRPSDPFKHSNFALSDYKPVDYKPPVSDNYKHDSYDRPAADYKHADKVKHVNYKHIDYKHVDYKSPSDYKPEHVDDDADLDEHLEDGGQHPVYDHHPYPHDDHLATDLHEGGGGDDDNDVDGGGYKSSPSRQPQSSEYVSHISIEPSIQVATFSETDTRSSGTGRPTVSMQGVRPACRCPATGHRHKRHAAPDNDTAAVGVDSVAEPSAVTRGNSFGASRRNAGHATEVVIQKSHDITDNLMPAITANSSEQRPIDGGSDARWPMKTGTTFRDDSDMFKVDFGRNAGARDKPETRERYLLDDDANARDGGDFGNRQVRKPDQPRGYHVIKSAVENNGGEVSFSVQTPFSVSSFASNVRQRPYAEEHDDDDRSEFQFTEPRTMSSSSSSSDHYLKPLDFEQFGFKSALQTSGRQQAGQFSRNGFNDRSPSVFGGDRFFDDETFEFSSSGDSRLGRPFSRDLGDDRSKPFRYNTRDRGGLLSSSNRGRFNAGGSSSSSPLLKSGATSDDGSVLEYFQPVVVDVFGKSDDNKPRFKAPAAFGNHNGGNNYGDRSRYFGKTANPTGFSKFRRNQNPNPLRLPGGLHESTENLSRKMVFHPSTFDVDQ